MLTEVSPMTYSVKVNGQFTHSNLPSYPIAEAILLQLPEDKRKLAEIVATTTDGRQMLLG